MPTLEEEYDVLSAWIPSSADMARHLRYVDRCRAEYAQALAAGSDPSFGGLFEPQTPGSSTFNTKFLWLPPGAVARFFFARSAEAFAQLLPDASVVALYPQAKNRGTRIQGLGVMHYVFSSADPDLVESKRLEFLAYLQRTFTSRKPMLEEPAHAH